MKVRNRLPFDVYQNDFDPYKVFEMSLKQSPIIPSFVREFRFIPERLWRTDFCWPRHRPKLAVEIEGGSWLKKGGHTTGIGFNKDIDKYNDLALAGYYLLRFTPQQVEQGIAIQTIERFFQKRG
jgi:hypothetical protein